MSIFPQDEHVLFDAQHSAADVLMALSTLENLVYLENNTQPVIAFLPEKYAIHVGAVQQTFERIGLTNYVQTEHPFALDDFFHSSTEQSSEFRGGLIGYLSYDHAAAQHIHVKAKNQPRLFLGIYRSYLKRTQQGWLFCSTEPQAHALLAHLQTLLIDKRLLENQPEQLQLTQPCTARWSFEQYKQAFEQVQAYILAGDCYQINLTQEFVAQAHGQLLTTAAAFWQLTNAPYSAYLKIDEFELLSCSPELFIDFKQNRQIVTKPIKGTMPRYKDAVLDDHSKQSLIHSEKDRAENVMIVDLLRNDLSVYAETGSVKTPKLFNIESFNQVHHMVSEVTATLKTDINPFAMLMSALPGGSITGAPKIRAMQIIEELEQAPRGAYCGSIGYFNFDGTGSWNILIRSIQKQYHDISVWAGGGITIASNVDAEYQECFDKVDAMLNLLNTWYRAE